MPAKKSVSKKKIIKTKACCKPAVSNTTLILFAVFLVVSAFCLKYISQLQ